MFPVCCVFTSRCLVSDPLLPYWHSYRLATVPQLTPTLLTAVSSLCRNRSCFSLYNLGTDRKGNTSSSFIVPLRTYRMDHVENAASQLPYCCLLRICCPTTGVFAEPFPRNGCLWSLHSSCLEQICHSNMEFDLFHSRFRVYGKYLIDHFIGQCVWNSERIGKPANEMGLLFGM
jgi:hypothetical protein